MIFLFDVKPLACDFTCNYPSTCSLKNHFVLFSGHFSCVLHHLQICNFWDSWAVTYPWWFTGEGNQKCSVPLRHPEQKSVPWGINNVPRKHQHAILNHGISRFLKLQRRCNYLQEPGIFKVEATIHLKMLYLKKTSDYLTLYNILGKERMLSINTVPPKISRDFVPVFGGFHFLFYRW